MALNLPDLATFLAENIEHLETCALCSLPFDKSTHSPVCIRGAHDCPHTYGSACLLKHLRANDSSDAHKCPRCAVILLNPLHKPNFVLGPREPLMTLNQLRTRNEVELFVRQLWNNLRSLNDKHHIYDSDIEEQITKSLDLIACVHEYEDGLVIRKEDWESVMGVAKGIVEIQFRIGASREVLRQQGPILLNVLGEGLGGWPFEEKEVPGWFVDEDEEDI